MWGEALNSKAAGTGFSAHTQYERSGPYSDGSAYPLFGDSVTMGRERGDINFPDDGYVSGLHARMFTKDGKVFLNDLGSSNGTFMKVDGERAMSDGSFVLLGQQLFRLEIHS